jgi:uncharacterized protein with GYD domain
VKEMVTFLTISRHTPADCAAHNEAAAKAFGEWMSTHEALEAKHGIKMVGTWVVHGEHLTVQVFEAPNSEAMIAYSVEPVMVKMMNFNTVEAKIAMTIEETWQLVQMMQQK